MMLRTLCTEIAQKHGFVLTFTATKSPGAWMARFVARDKVCVEFELDLEGRRARFEDFQVLYSSVSQVYSWNRNKEQGEIAQYSPFDDGPAWPTHHSVELWSERLLRHYLATGRLGYVH
jgi:hypothetical protein